MQGNRGMEQLIPLVNKLQDAFASLSVPLALDLPQIAVVGSQSAGKSSVLENFVGRDFLPRGSGIVTRRPLVLQLMNDNVEFGEFAHLRNKRFTDFNDIRREIEAETDRVTGSNKGISNIPINLRVHSPNVLNLTLIDLPGMTKVAVGDQPPDIEIQIRAMIVEFIERENCLILAVTPANSDLANSDALKLAKEYDPQGLRTIGVLTKLDLMDEGTHARDILENKLLPLRRGYVGVVNRSQRDIEGKKDINAALLAEKRFFLGHTHYRHMADRLGTPYLQLVLNQQLTNHIRETLPNLRDRLQTQMLNMQAEVNQFHAIKADDPNYKASALLGMLRSFETEFTGIIDGYTNVVNTTELSGGAEIGRIFHERFPYDMLEIQFDESLLRKEIGIVIQNIHGVRPGLFTPDKAFDSTVHRLIDKMRPPSMKCVDLVVNKLTDIVHSCSESLARYPHLRDELVRLVNTRVRECEVVTRQQIDTFINFQLAYTNTNHEDFIGFKKAEQNAKTPGAGKLTNQVVCKGWLSLVNPNLFRGGSKYFFFVLSTETLRWFKDDEEKELKYVLQLEGVRQRDGDTGFFSKRPTFILYHPDPKVNLYKDHKTVDLSADTSEAVDAWKAALLRVGVFPYRSTSHDDEGESDVQVHEDPRLQRQVEVVCSLVDSYMKIVNKTQRDMVPKIIMYELISKAKEYLRTELTASIYSQDANTLMQESESEKQHREEVLKMFDAIKQALDIIRDVMTNTQAAPLPPPIKDDWLELDTLPSNTAKRTPHHSSNTLQPTPVPIRPITPPPSTSSIPGTLSLLRPIPSRPAPNLPTRVNQPSPVPHRLLQGANVHQSASTGNLSNMTSSAVPNSHSTVGSATSVWRAFDPLINDSKVQSAVKSSINDQIAMFERAPNPANAPKIPPRPN